MSLWRVLLCYDVVLIVIMLTMLSVVNAVRYYTDCDYAVCHYDKCHHVECHYNKCQNAECHYTE